MPLNYAVGWIKHIVVQTQFPNRSIPRTRTITSWAINMAIICTGDTNSDRPIMNADTARRELQLVASAMASWSKAVCSLRASQTISYEQPRAETDGW